MDQILTHKLFGRGSRERRCPVLGGLSGFLPENQPQKRYYFSELQKQIGRQFLKVIFCIILNGIHSTIVLFVTIRLIFLKNPKSHNSLFKSHSPPHTHTHTDTQIYRHKYCKTLLTSYV